MTRKRFGRYRRSEWSKTLPRGRKKVWLEPQDDESQPQSGRNQPSNEQETGDNPDNSDDSRPSDDSNCDSEPSDSGQSSIPELVDDEQTTVEPTFTLDELPPRPALLPGLQLADGVVIRDFPSFYDFFICATDPKLDAWGHKYEFNSHSPDHPYIKNINWFGTSSFDEAIDLALNGWPEGRKLLSNTLAQVASQLSSFQSQSYDVGGAFPVVPLFIAGDPACMIEFQNDHIASRPIVRIDYDCGAVNTITPESIMFYGAAVLSLAIELEALGHSVELRVTSEVSPTSAVAPNHRTTFVYKKAGENLDLDRAAFVLIHPSLMRRFIFAIREQHEDLEEAYHYSYGRHGTITQVFDVTTVSIPRIPHNLDAREAKSLVEASASAWLNQKDLAA